MFDISIFAYIFKTKQIYFTLIFIIYLFALIIGVAPLYFPSILYGFPQSIVSNAKKTYEKSDIIKDKYGLDETEILKKLESLITEEIYLQNNFDLNHLSAFLEIPVHHTSYFFKQYYKMSFATYRNQLRMEYAKKMIVSGYLNQNTIEALSWKCGFSSRSAFTKTFKTYTGLNPSEFIQ
jgi:AraC-like DNA-binding protein